jgi:CheY-like chemotaxis protein
VKQKGGAIRHRLFVGDRQASDRKPLDIAAGGFHTQYWRMSAMGGAAILLVDDDDGVRSVCRRALEKDGARVVEATSGVAALDFVQDWHGQPDLVIADLRMPRINGRALAEVLSIFRPDLPVLGMTSDPGQPDRRLPTLVKPFTIEDLVEAARLMRANAREIRTWAEERRARARQARQLAAEMMTRNSALQQRVSLVTVALELQRLEGKSVVHPVHLS